jgi:hypothetical protein
MIPFWRCTKFLLLDKFITVSVNVSPKNKLNIQPAASSPISQSMYLSYSPARQLMTRSADGTGYLSLNNNILSVGPEISFYAWDQSAT